MKKIVVEFILIILVLNFFYEGIYKIAYFKDYALWLHYAPFLRPVSGALSYIIPSFEISIALALLFPSFRAPALVVSISSLILFVLWIMSVYLFTHRLFWPFHALWKKPTWMQKMTISMGLSWLCFAAMAFKNENRSNDLNKSNSLRETPANRALAGNG